MTTKAMTISVLTLLYMGNSVPGLTTGLAVPGNFLIVSINLGHVYTMGVYSSLYPDQMPAFTAYADKWARVNWLFNHLDNYPGHTWGEVQGAIWIIMDNWNGNAHSGVPTADAMTHQMANDSHKVIPTLRLCRADGLLLSSYPKEPTPTREHPISKPCLFRLTHKTLI